MVMKKSSKKVKSSTWFVKVRGSYLPNSWQAWALYVPFIVFLMTVMQDAIRTQSSAQDVFYSVFPQWIAAAVVMTWIAARKS